MDDYTTRVATIDDAAGVGTLLKIAYPVLMEPAYEKALLVSVLERMTKANPDLLASGTYYVAESRRGLIVGCGGWTAERPGDGATEAGLGHIRHFATHPDWTNRGIGRAIYRLCEVGARATGITRFECYSSLNAENFYAALGFETMRRIDVDLGSNVALPSILMQRPIP